MNQFTFNYQNNPINNFQQGYPNFVGNIPPQVQNINNNIYNNFNNFNELNSEKQIYFRFMNGQTFTIKTKLKEKLIDIINKFKNTECPNELKNSLFICVIHAQKIQNLNKTLYDLNIKDKDFILFIDSPSEYEQNKEEYVLTEREKKQMDLLKLEYAKNYEIMNLDNEQKLINNYDNDYKNEDIPSFKEYMEKKESKMGVGIKVKEHKCILVYCLTNVDWKCNICNVQYKKENSKYYCSICDFNMCENCHYKNNYFMKKSFPKGAKPSNKSVNVHFFNTDYHEHRLVFCRSSRRFCEFSKWICNNCTEVFNNNIWSFYCTLCDYDICCDCCGFH